MRHKLKSWQDRRPGWTRRITWYEPDIEGGKIRLKIETEWGRVNHFYQRVETADGVWQVFKEDAEQALPPQVQEER